MISWVRERCFSHLEKEQQKNNLLLFVILATYGLAECNVLLNHSFQSGNHLIFLAASTAVAAIGFVLNRVKSFVYSFKYIMMSLLLVHAMGQIVIFKELPAVYQVLYFNLALTLIYLNGKLTLYVGVVSFLFTLAAGRFSNGYFSYLEPQTLNIPLGIFAETTVVLWAATKIGTRFASILETKEKLARLLKENETQLRIIEKQNKTLESYAFQVEAIAREEERSKLSEEHRSMLKELATALLWDSGTSGASRGVPDEAASRIQQTVGLYLERLSRAEEGGIRFHPSRLNEQIAEFEKTTGVPVEWKTTGEPKDIAASHGSILMRAVQDFLIYSAMYRQATAIEAELSFHSEFLMVVLSDNGMDVDDRSYKDVFAHLVERVTEVRGQLDVQSFRGKGSVLTLRLPYEFRTGGTISVVVADPDPFIRESLGLILGKEEDIEIVASLGSGEELAAVCERLAPDVIVMELDLPGSNGIAATRQIKSKHGGAKVVILTNRHEVGIVAEAIEAGVDAYLLKSANPGGLAASIRYMMDGGTLLSRQTTAMLANQAMHNRTLENAEKKYMSQAIAQEYGLKEREIEILGLLAKGKKYKEIASALFLTEGTVRNYLSAIYTKLNVEDRHQAVEKALRLGLYSIHDRAG